MESRLIELADYRLNKGKEKLSVANLLFEEKFYLDAVSKAYYAMYQVARAILITKGMDSRKHSGIISLFNQHFVKTGLVARDFGKMLAKTRDIRESSDYEDFYIISKEEAKLAISNAERFIREIEKILKEIITEGKGRETND